MNGHGDAMLDVKQSERGARVFDAETVYDYMTAEELRCFVDALRKVAEHGWGSLLLEVHEGRVKFITISERHIMPR